MPREPSQRASRSEGPYSPQSATPVRHMLPKMRNVEADEAFDLWPSLENTLVEAKQPPVVPETKLSEEQNKILDIVLKGENVFFTGPAGTGKSVLLKAIIRKLMKTELEEGTIAVTATTGVASLAIEGKTLHSHGGIGYGNEVVELLLKKIKRFPGSRDRWVRTKVWIIDEISMLKAELFDKLEYIARCIRNDPRPFGGIQLVLAGDFFQLPPVSKRGSSRPPDYVFSAKSWNACIPKPYFLQKVFRQNDDDFISLLSAMRLGSLNQKQNDCLRSLERPLICDAEVQPSVLLSSRAQVVRHNTRELERLPGGSKHFSSMDSAGWDTYRRPIRKTGAQKLLNSGVLAPEMLTLKVGARVMLIQNVIQGVLVNGSLGDVIDFMTISEATQKDILISQLQSTDSEPPNDLDSEDGLDYDEDDDFAKPPTPPFQYQHRTYIEERILASYRGDPNIQRRTPELVPITDNTFQPGTDEYPLVQFENGKVMLCAPLFFDNVGMMGNIEARRVQVPLILSWAITIHKSQGQTLTHVKVDFNNIFAAGQAYVAVSRATSIEGLQVINFKPDKVFANPRVLKWHKHWQEFWNQQRAAETSRLLKTTNDSESE